MRKQLRNRLKKNSTAFRKDLKWQLIRNKIARENEIKITEEELLKEAENITRYQFQQYGLFYATDEQINNYAKETLKREEDAKRIADKILEEKVIVIMKELVKLENKSVLLRNSISFLNSNQCIAMIYINFIIFVVIILNLKI